MLCNQQEEKRGGCKTSECMCHVRMRDWRTKPFKSPQQSSNLPGGGCVGRRGGGEANHSGSEKPQFFWPGTRYRTWRLPNDFGLHHKETPCATTLVLETSQVGTAQR